MNFLTNEEIEELSSLKIFIEEIYESKCLYTNKEDILNCLYELQYERLGLLIHQYWNEDDATFGAKLRERFRKDFLKVSYLEAFEK